MKNILRGAAALLMAVCSPSASASPTTWVLQGVTFADGGTASGSFVYDADTLTYSSINLSASGVGTFSFRAFGTQFFLTAVDSNAADLTGAHMLQLIFAAPLTNAGGTIAITPSSFNTSFKGLCATANCGSATTAIFLTGGSVTVDCSLTTSPCITNPRSGATPASAYVALSGVGTANAMVDIVKDASPVTTVIVSQSGTWEAVVDVGAGPHIMRTRYTGNPSSTSPAVNITNIGNLGQQPLVLRSTFEKMQTADAILVLNLTSPQVALYGPNYSHVALFLGGDTNGTPLIAEAVTAQEGGTLGQVRSVPLELSTVYTDGRLVDFYRRFDITDAERASIASWASGITSQGLPYFNVATDLAGPFLTAALFWNFQTHQPTNASRFNLAAGYLSAEKFRVDKFICSTLVWRSYYEGTGHRVDISLPNNIAVSPASVLGNWVSDPAFINQLRPYFVFPDTIALSGKLSRVP